MRDALDLYDLPFYNNSGEAIPPYAVMQVDNWKDDANNRDYFRVRKPNGSGKMFIVNGPLEVAIAGDGMGSRREGIPARYLSGTPAPDEEWGPTSGSWYLSASGSGFNIVGGNETLSGATVTHVNLAGASSGNIIYAQVVGNVTSGDPTFTFDNAVAEVGSIPTGGTGTAQNQYGQEYVDNEWVHLFQRKDNSQWLTERGGTSGSQVVYCEATENKGYADPACLAKPVLEDGSLDSGATAFYIVDDTNGFYIRTGWRYHAVRFTDDYSEGVPGFRIIAGEGPAHFMVVTLDENYNPLGTDATPSSSPIHGKPFRGVAPSGELAIHDDYAVAAAALTGDKWLVAFDEDDEHYNFIVLMNPQPNWMLRFETTASKYWSTSSVAGVLLGGSDTPVGGGITLIDRAPAKHEAMIGSRGWCVFNGTTFEIVTMDSPARWVEGTLDADWELDDDHATFTVYNWWGASPNHLEHEAEWDTVDIYDNVKVRSRKYFAGETFRGIWDEKLELFVTNNTPGDYITIKGTTGAVSRSDGSFTLAEPVGVNGQVPTGTITVTNDPPINTPGGRVVYARFNYSIGSNLQTAWDTGDGGNILLHLRGLADWSGSVQQPLDHDADGDPHWHGSAPCTPPE